MTLRGPRWVLSHHNEIETGDPIDSINEDGTFKTPEQLKALYEPKGVTPDREVIACCRIGERSSHTWFVLKYLLGCPNVRNYDGSWTEWGNLVRTPIEKP